MSWMKNLQGQQHGGSGNFSLAYRAVIGRSDWLHFEFQFACSVKEHATAA